MSNLQQIQNRITFLEEQLESLEHYLPETYQLLMAEMDVQQRALIELKIQNFYSAQTDELQDKNSDS
jgi:hypothetical protein